MFLEIASGAFLLGNYIYHRWTAEEPKKPVPQREVMIPRTDEGASYPLVYGRCRVDAPVLVWAGTPSIDNYDDISHDFVSVAPGEIRYRAGMLFAIGVPFISGTNKVYRMYAGEVVLNNVGASHFPPGPPDYVEMSELDGEGFDEHELRTCRMSTGNFENPYPDPGIVDPTGLHMIGFVEFLNGNPQQQLVNSLGTPITKAGQIMVDGGVPHAKIPGFRNRMLVCLTGGDGLGINPPDDFVLGSSPNYPLFSFDVSSYPGGTGLGGTQSIGAEANPMDVLYDVLTSPHKLGFPFARVDLASFTEAAVKLREEGHGYSRAIESPTEGRALIDEICQQVDAVIFEDPTDLLIKVKLVRATYNPADVLRIAPENCLKIENLSLGGWANVVNKVRIIFKNRQEHYREDSVTAHNMANAVGQDGIVREVVLSMPGVCTRALAMVIAQRELAARSRPIMKCRATVDRSLRNVNPGDVLSVTYPDYHLDSVIFRVANVERGTLEDGAVKLDLIQDFNYVRRGLVVSPDLNSFPPAASLENFR